MAIRMATEATMEHQGPPALMADPARAIRNMQAIELQKI